MNFLHVTLIITALVGITLFVIDRRRPRLAGVYLRYVVLAIIAVAILTPFAWLAAAVMKESNALMQYVFLPPVAEWGEKLGLKFPLLSDLRREMTRAYGVLNDDATMATDTKRIPTYLRAKRSWFVVDKEGIVRYVRVTDPRGLVPNDEILEVLAKLK